MIKIFKHILLFSVAIAIVLLSQMSFAQACQDASCYKPPGRLIQVHEGDAVNVLLGGYHPGMKPPFPSHGPVFESVPTEVSYLVRVYTQNATSPIGTYLVHPNWLRQLTPEQIRDRLALPTLPTHLVYVKLIPGQHYGMWTGPVAPIPEWGEGGGVQTKIIGPHRENYGYLPLDSYMNSQPIGQEALAYAQSVNEGNAEKVARYLDQHLPEPYSEIALIYTTLDFINAGNPSQLAQALEQLSPINFDSLSFIALRNDLLFERILLNHPHKLTRAKQGCLASWASLAGEGGRLKPAYQTVGFDYQSLSVATGFDCQLQPYLTIGAGLGYLHNNLHWASNNLGHVDINNIKFGAYSLYKQADYFLNAILTTGYSWDVTRRQINFSGYGIAVASGLMVDSLNVNSTAMSQQTGQNLGVYIRGGKSLNFNTWTLTPTAQFSYFYARQGAFNERGADSLNLAVNAFFANTWSTQLEMFASKELIFFGTKPISLSTGLGWANYLPLDRRRITASLPALGGSMQVNGYTKTLNTALLSVQANSQLNKQLFLSGQYKIELGKRFYEQLALLKLRYSF